MKDESTKILLQIFDLKYIPGIRMYLYFVFHIFRVFVFVFKVFDPKPE